MKKRLLSALLALALVFVLLPTTALAKVVKSDEDISIAGIDWKFESDSEVGYFYNGNFTTTEPSGSYLKLTKNSNTITVTVYGNVTVSDISVHNNFSTQDKINLIITGGNKRSTLTLNCTGISGAALETFQSGDITIKGGITVNANFSADNTDKYTDCYGIRASKNLIITGKGTTVNAVNADDAAAVKVDGNITVSDGAQLKATNKYSKKVTNYTGNAYAIECGGQLSISDGDTSNTKVTAKTSKGEKAISGTVSDGDKLTFKVQLYLASSTLYQRPMDEALGYKYVEITQAPTDPYVFIAGEPAIMGQETPIPGGSGTYLYVDAGYDGNILTLKDATINKTDSIKAVQAIRFGQNGYYTIKLEGENKISGFSSGIVAPNDPGVNDVTVVLSGSGSLDITANQYAIDMQAGNLKFENTGKIMLTTGHNYVKPLNALHVAGNVTIDKTKYDITGEKPAVNPTTEVISDNPNLDTILKGTSTDKDLYFKTITITPAAAKKSTISYGGKTLTQGQIINGEKGGTATVAPNGNTITLNNFKGDKALVFNAEFTPNSITLIGDSTLSAVETKYQSLTISGSGSGSLTAGSIKVHKEKSTSTTGNTIPNLTITGGAQVTVNRPSNEDLRAIDIDGNLTVENNATLTATSNSTKPTVQVGGNASFTGSTVTITNNSTEPHKDATEATKGDSVSSALYVKGNINITDNANVTAKVENGGGNAIGAVGNITVNGSTVTAVNKGQKFTTIIAKNVYVSGDSKITANNLNGNPDYNGWYLAFPAIEGNIVNKNTDYSLNFKGEHSSSSEPKTTLAPGEQTTLYYYNVTITRGDEVARTESPVVIDGHTLLNDTYYTINGSTVDEGTESNYNAFYDSATKTLKLNNAKISTTTKNAAIKISEDLTITVTGTNELKGNYNHCIESYNNFTINGTGTLNMTNTSSSSSAASVIYCGPYKNLTIAAEVIIKNEAKPGNLIFTVEKDAYSFATGYNVYASTDVSGSPLEAYDAARSSTYKYLRITTQTLETGGGSTHEHVFSASWESNADYHWHKCTVQGCTEVSDKEAHVYTNTWWKNSNGNHGRTCDKCRHEGEIHEFRKYYDFADETYHVERCGYLNCTYVGRQETHSYDSFGICKCGYSPNGLPAPPSLQGVAPTSENGTDGKILNSNIGMEYAQNLNGPWTKWNEHSNITGLSAGTYYVRYTKTDERFPDNQVATVEVPAYTPGGDPTPDIPAAPTGLAGVAPTSANSKDGKITGTTAAMEYATEPNGSNWIECGGDEVIGLSAGTYYVRYKQTTDKPASAVATVVVPAYSGGGEIVPPTPDNPGTIVIIRPAEEEKPAQQPNPSTGANDLVGLAVAAAVAAALGSAALLRKHD